MNPLSYAKAGIAGIAAPIADWLITLLAASTAAQGVPMPEPVQVALVSLLVGLIVWWVPNLPPGTEFPAPGVKAPPVVPALLLAALLLSGCAGFSSVDPEGLRTTPGAAAMTTTHTSESACPNLVLAGAVTVSRAELRCEADGSGLVKESASFENIDPVPAMAESNKAMAQVIALLAKLIPAGPVPVLAPSPDLIRGPEDAALYPEQPLIIDGSGARRGAP